MYGGILPVTNKPCRRMPSKSPVQWQHGWSLHTSHFDASTDRRNLLQAANDALTFAGPILLNLMARYLDHNDSRTSNGSIGSLNPQHQSRSSLTNGSITSYHAPSSPMLGVHAINFTSAAAAAACKFCFCMLCF